MAAMEASDGHLPVISKTARATGPSGALMAAYRDSGAAREGAGEALRAFLPRPFFLGTVVQEGWEGEEEGGEEGVPGGGEGQGGGGGRGTPRRSHSQRGAQSSEGLQDRGLVEGALVTIGSNHPISEGREWE